MLGVVLLIAAQWYVIENLAERFWWSALLAYLPQHLSVIFLLIAALWALRDRDWLMAAITALLVSIWLYGPMGLRIRPQQAEPNQATRILSWNVHHMPRGLEPIKALVLQQRIDIACFMEANELPGPDRQLATYALPEGWCSIKADDVVIWSRWPITRWRAWRVPAARRSMLEAVIRTPDGETTVYAAHFATRWPADSAAKGGIVSQLESAARARRAQSAILSIVTADSQRPQIICGDLNLPPRGLAYRRLSGSYQDAFEQTGVGFGYTWPARMPMLRIDYVWASCDLRVISCRALHTRASDHRPVVASAQRIR